MAGYNPRLDFSTKHKNTASLFGPEKRCRAHPELPQNSSPARTQILLTVAPVSRTFCRSSCVNLDRFGAAKPNPPLVLFQCVCLMNPFGTCLEIDTRQRVFPPVVCPPKTSVWLERGKQSQTTHGQGYGSGAIYVLDYRFFLSHSNEKLFACRGDKILHAGRRCIFGQRVACYYSISDSCRSIATTRQNP